MTSPQLLVILAVLVTAAACAALTPAVLSWLPEPAAQPGEKNVTYRALATPRFVLACALCSAVAAAVAWTVLPPAVQPLWTVLSVGGVLLAAIDAATTWLPLPLIQVTWASMAVAALVGASLAGSWTMLVRTAAGALLAGALYLVAYWATRHGIAFGDVRFAPLLGAAAAAASWELLVWSLLAGSLVGGVQGAAQLVRRRRGSFAYAPAMLTGSYLAALVHALGR